mmetsp:Transcript_51618/g.62091  ORF Transcript_51618/g.62091 Transcript_51618/m.62091 type:complete len:80 (-) Transcript_51618:592-831(-)
MFRTILSTSAQQQHKICFQSGLRGINLDSSTNLAGSISTPGGKNDSNLSMSFLLLTRALMSSPLCLTTVTHATGPNCEK